MKGKKIGLVSLVGTQTAADLEMPNIPKAPKIRAEGELDQYGRVKRQPREEREFQSSRADEDSMWRRGGGAVPSGRREDNNDREGGWKRGGGQRDNNNDSRDGWRRGDGGRSNYFDRSRDNNDRSPPRETEESRRPRLKLSKRTLPVKEIKKTTTLGEAFGKKTTTTTKPKSNPFGSARPVDTGMRKLKEKLDKKSSSPFGNAKPVDTKPIDTKPTKTSHKNNPFGDARPKKTRDPFVVESSSTSTTSNKENQTDAKPKEEEPKIPIRTKSPPPAAVEKMQTGETNDNDDHGEDEGEWETTGSKKRNKKKNDKKTTKKKNKKSEGAERRIKDRRERREPRRPKTNSRWARDESEEQDSISSKPRDERRQQQRQRSRSPPVPGNSRWNRTREEMEDHRGEERKSRSPPQASNSRWKEEDNRQEERRQQSRSPPVVANSRWARQEKEDIDMSEYQKQKNITPPVVSENSRWASLKRDEEESSEDRRRRRRRRDDDDDDLESPSQPPKPLNSRWAAGETTTSSSSNSVEEPPQSRNSRWKEHDDTTTTTTTRIVEEEVKREKSEKELELDRRIAAIRARKNNKSAVKTDMFGRPIVEKKKEEEKVVMKMPTKKPAAATTTTTTTEKVVKRTFCTTPISKENLEMYEKMEDKSILEKKTRSLLNEYNMVHDVKEAVLCIKELECPAYYSVVVKQIINRTLESFKAKDVELAQKLLVAMRETLIVDVVLAKELNEAAEFMDDIKMDCPKAPKIFVELAGYLLKMDGLIHPKHVKPETWKCANLEAPKRDPVDVLTDLFETSKTRGEDLYDEIQKVVVGEPLKVLQAVLRFVLSSGKDDLLEKDEDDTNKFTAFADEMFGAALMKCFDETSLDVQKAAVFELQQFCCTMKFPQGLCEAVFMTCQDEEILESSAFFAWAADKSNKEIPGRLQARKETLAWIKWLEEEGDDDSDSEDE